MRSDKNALSDTPRKATVRDVAQLAGVSDATVSRVFSNYPGVTEENRQAVMTAAQKIGYEPRKRALSVSIDNLLFCLRKLEDVVLDNPYFSNILHGVQSACNDRDISATILSVDPVASSLKYVERVIRQSSIDGILLVNLLDEALVTAVVELGLPTILIDDYFPHLVVDSLSSDAFHGVLQGMAHLLEQGHRQIAMIDGPHSHFQARMRFAAYRQALDDAGLPYEPEMVIHADLTSVGAMQAMEHLLQSGKTFTAVFCSNDASAFGAMRTLQMHNIQIPTDVSVIAHDDVSGASLVSPPLTTLRVQMMDMGKVAVQRLQERATNPEAPTTLSLLPEKLVIRSSVAKLR
jgi:LacI family transcriptional regulator